MARLNSGNTAGTAIKPRNFVDKSYLGLFAKPGKEAMKLVVQLMIEDIWNNYENYSLQRKVVMQSQEFKKGKQNKHMRQESGQSKLTTYTGLA